MELETNEFGRKDPWYYLISGMCDNQWSPYGVPPELLKEGDSMLLIGLAFLVDWLLVQVFALDSLKAVLVTAIIFILLGVLVEGPDYYGRRPRVKL